MMGGGLGFARAVCTQTPQGDRLAARGAGKGAVCVQWVLVEVFWVFLTYRPGLSAYAYAYP